MREFITFNNHPAINTTIALRDAAEILETEAARIREFAEQIEHELEDTPQDFTSPGSGLGYNVLTLVQSVQRQIGGNRALTDAVKWAYAPVSE